MRCFSLRSTANCLWQSLTPQQRLDERFSPFACAMFEPIEAQEPDPKILEEIYRRAPVGALTVAGIATGIVFGLWLAFYLLVFLPRGILR
jgi:hypothetical protein